MLKSMDTKTLYARSSDETDDMLNQLIPSELVPNGYHVTVRATQLRCVSGFAVRTATSYEISLDNRLSDQLKEQAVDYLVSLGDGVAPAARLQNRT